jgi:hypothetical protein
MNQGQVTLVELVGIGADESQREMVEQRLRQPQAMAEPVQEWH